MIRIFSAVIAVTLIFILCISCSSKPLYSVDYGGLKELFSGAKDSYHEGDRVVLKYSLIATDTDYNFDVNTDYTVDYEKGAYIIRFIMPAHNVTVSLTTENTMTNMNLTGDN